MYDLRNKAKSVWEEEIIDESEYIIPILDINNLNIIEEPMNNFEKSESIGRSYCLSWLKQLKAENIKFSTNTFDVIDVCFEYANKKIAAEIKVRDEKYRTYNTHLIELNKLINISNYVDKNNKDGAIYINFFGENWLYIYNINQINTNCIKNWNLVVTTAEDNGTKNKEIIEIPNKLAQVYYRLNKESIWTRIK